MPISLQHLPQSITTNAELASIVERCSSGRLDGIEDELADLLRTCRDATSARHLLAILKFVSGERNEALEEISRLMNESEHDASLHNTLGHMFLDMEMPPEAEAAYRAALDIVPDDFEPLWSLGNLMQLVGRPQDAEQFYRDATVSHPANGLGHLSLGGLLLTCGRPEDACISLERAAELAPDDVDALNHLGIAQAACRHFIAAESAFRRALAVKPDDPTALHHMGRLMQRSGQTAKAENLLRRAMTMDSGNPRSGGSLADLLTSDGRLDEAETLLTAMAQRFPQDGMCRMQLGLLQLRRGAYAQGWMNFEGRQLTPALGHRLATQRLWNGEILDGKSLLVTSEGSIGDVIQFLRHLESPIRLGREVALAVPDPFVALLQTNRLGVKIVSESSLLESFDYVTRIMSLPLFTGQLAPFWPLSGPYLTADPTLVKDWHHRLGSTSKRRIAIAVSDGGGIRPEFPLDLLRSITELADVEFVCLATGRTAADIAKSDAADRLRMIEDEVPTERFFEHAAAVVDLCDRVVATDGDIAHLAGALGKDAWIMLDPTGGWRWGDTSDRTPLYPSIRLFREARASGWVAAVRAVSEALTA
ncbi:MAG: tetratricopeptide repeat protein [Boseongicola sp. SB0675_bin_26]|nr:tetratricopeptide repeat protein [Boseongicola sp. SB0675_bin_26]